MRTVAKHTIRATSNIMKYVIHDWDKEDKLKKRLYRLAKRKGLALKLYRKSEGPDRNTFRILDRTSGAVVHSARPGGYGLTLDQVEEYLSHHSSKEQVGTKQTVVNQTTVEAIREIRTQASRGFDKKCWLGRVALPQGGDEKTTNQTNTFPLQHPAPNLYHCARSALVENRFVGFAGLLWDSQR